ncbi:MAG TPA: SDR family oxidoreductase [Microthrixaceae bacterium]|nr:SDR family oxidoreductase [Microthrixaceae bacterium]
MTRTYVVTGAASGIGLATVQKLQGLGHRTVTVDRRDADVDADLSTRAGRDQMVEAVNALTGGVVDAVVASAGTNNRGRIDVQVNFFGAVATLAGLRPLLAAGSAPRAVAVSSFAVLEDIDEATVDACLAGDEPAAIAAVDALGQADLMQVYASSKRALARWVRRNAPTAHWAGAGIALNTVGPGVVHTPMTEPLLGDPGLSELLLAAVPMPFQGVLAPEALAHHLVALTDPELRGMTGQTIFVDGGADCLRRGDDVWR